MKTRWQARRILVTGATGFLGSHLVRALVQRGAEVGVLVREGSDTSRLRDVLPNVQVLSGDLLKAEQLQALVADFKPVTVFHLAAEHVNVWEGTPERSIMTNVLGTTHLLEACRARALESFLYVGTCFEYGHRAGRCRESDMPAPANVYAASKSAGWLLSSLYERMCDLPVVSVRPFQVYGPDEPAGRLLPSILSSVKQGKEVQVTKGRQVRDFIFVTDVIDGMLHAATCPQARGRTLNIGTGRGVTIRAVIEKLMDVLHHPVRVRYGAVPYRKGEMWRLVADMRQTKRLLDWQPAVSLDEGLRRTVAWYEQWRDRGRKAVGPPYTHATA